MWSASLNVAIIFMTEVGFSPIPNIAYSRISLRRRFNSLEYGLKDGLATFHKS